MRIPRIYQDTELATGHTLQLDEQASAHVQRVLRLPENAELFVFDGRGREFAAVITGLQKRSVTVLLQEEVRRQRESPLTITLAQGISRGERMDYTLQKAVELGVSRIVPLNTERSVVNLRGERADKRLRHWQGVVQSACEQCGRNVLPVLEAADNLPDWLARSGAGRKLLLYHEADASIADVAETPMSLTLLIGPEGGLSESERAAAVQAGFREVRFGPRVLRTETAALAAIAVLQARWGDLLRI